VVGRPFNQANLHNLWGLLKSTEQAGKIFQGRAAQFGRSTGVPPRLVLGAWDFLEF
jgi:hypothetical protein